MSLTEATADTNNVDSGEEMVKKVFYSYEFIAQ